MWSRNYTGEAETFVMWSQGGVEICLFLLDQTARMDTKKVSTCRGSFGGFETTCFQLDRAASSIGHPPHSSASPVELRLRVGPRALSGKKKELGNRGC